MESTTPTKKRKQSARCETCDTMFSSEQDLYAHLLTKDHMMATTEATELRRPFCVKDPSLAVYVNGLSLRHSLYELQNVFQPYGEIRHMFLTKISKYEAGCLVEYTRAGAVDAVLKRLPRLNGRSLNVKKYSIKSSLVSHEASNESQSSHKKVCTDSDSVKPSSSRSSSPIKMTPPSERNGTAKDTSASQPSSSKTSSWSVSSKTNKDNVSTTLVFKKSDPPQLSPAGKLLKVFEDNPKNQNTSKQSDKDQSLESGKHQSSSGISSNPPTSKEKSDQEKVPNKSKSLKESQPQPSEKSSRSRESSPSKSSEKTRMPPDVSQSVSQASSSVVSAIDSRNIVENTSRASLQDTPQKHSPRVKIDDKLYDDQIIDFVSKLQETLPRIQYKYQEVFEGVKKAIGLLNVQYSCYLFGSSFTGLCWEGSDLDIFIQWGQIVHNPDVVLNECRKVLFKSGLFEKVIIIRARTPVIKCQHRRHQLQCDISFKSRLGVYNSILIKILLLFDTRVQTMIVFLKYWGQKNELIGSNKINSYCLCWMIIFFLQLQNILPTIEYLNSFAAEKLSYYGWDVSFFNLPHLEISNIRNQFLLQNPYQEKSIRQLLIEFFDYYLTFDYGKNVICPLIGTTIPRTNFEKLTDLPRSMAQFLREAQTLCMSRPDDFTFDRTRVFCLQDPIELTFNIGKCVSPKLKDHFKLCCKTATQILVTEKVEMIVPKLTQGQNSNEAETKSTAMTGQEEVSSTVDQTLRMLKKSYCHTISIRNHLFKEDARQGISDLFSALILVLNKCLQFEISVCPKNMCTDEVINKKYLQFGKKFNLDWCQIIFCEGYSVLFHSQKKLKGIIIPNKLKDKSEFEQDIFRKTTAFQREMASKSPKQQSNEKFCLVFCFSPSPNSDSVDITFMRYFKHNSIPGANNYHAFFDYAQRRLQILINQSLSFINANREKIDLSSQLKLICADYQNLLMPSFSVTESSSNSTDRNNIESLTVDPAKKGQSNSESAKEDETSTISKLPSKSTPSIIKSEPSLGEIADSDSDIEIVPVEPKVFECIDVE